MTHAPVNSRPTTVALRISPLIEIDLAVYGQTTEAGIKRSQFSREGNPVGYLKIDKVTALPLRADEIVSKIATDSGPVFVEDHELEALFEIDPNTLVIKTYQPKHLFGEAYVPKTPMFVAAAKRKVGTKKVANKVGEQLLASLLEVMTQEGLIAVCELTTRGIPKPAVLLPDGTMWVVYHDDEVREQPPRPEVELAPEAVAMVRDQFVLPLVTTEPLDLTDKRSEAIQAFADAKAAKGDFGQPDEPVVAAAKAILDDGTTDLMALLTASIASTPAKVNA